MTDLSRRSFLDLLCPAITSSIAASFVMASPAVAGIGLADQPPAERLLRVLRQQRSAGAIGRAALAEAGRTADPARIAESLLERHPALRQTLESERPNDDLRPSNGLRTAMQAAIRDDFTHGRTGLVQGWILAESEIDLCILAAA